MVGPWGGCLGTLMVIDAGNAGQAVNGFLHKATLSEPLSALPQRSGLRAAA